MRTGRNDSISVHFVGSIVYIEHGLFQVMDKPPLLVIDGQQRLTTITLLIAALAKALGHDEPQDSQRADYEITTFLTRKKSGSIPLLCCR
ncbi:hypothetical protein BH20ACI3_BH20ACI3_24380 [soil metagenome]